MSRAAQLFKAKMCEQAERYDDMVKIMKELITEKADLEIEERNLFSAAFKNLISGRRTAFRALSAIEQKEENKGSAKTPLIKDFKNKVEGEIGKICGEVVKLIEEKLFPSATKEDAKIFYIKMKADYYRYHCECLTGEAIKPVSTNAKEAYADATKLAEASLPVTDATRLGLALNFSVFHYEVLNEPQQACKIAKGAFDSAISQLEGLDDEQYKDSASILQLLRDNLTLWQNDANEGQDNA